MFSHITNGDTAELVINEVINKETLQRAEELMQYCKGHKFVLLKVYKFVDVWLDIAFLTLFGSEEKGGVDATGTVFFTQMQFCSRFALIFCVNMSF